VLGGDSDLSRTEGAMFRGTSSSQLISVGYMCKMDERIEMSFGCRLARAPMQNTCLMEAHTTLVPPGDTTDRYVRGGDATLCQITLATCSFMLSFYAFNVPLFRPMPAFLFLKTLPKVAYGY